MSSLRSQIARMRLILIIVILVAGAAVYFAFFNNQNQQQPLPDLAIAAVEKRDVKQIISVDGNLAGIKDQQVYFPSSSQVSALKVTLGESVKKDQVLAEVKVSTGFSTETRKIKSPIAGTVVAINYSKGDFVSPTTAGMRVVDQSNFVVEVPINENDIIDVRKGQSATIIVPAFSLEDEYKGEVTLVEPAPLTGVGAINYLTTVKPKNLPARARIGMSVIVEILAAQREDVLAIPESFLIERGDKLLVKRLIFLTEDKTEYKIDEVEVEIGLRTDEFVEIKSGISLGEQLIEPSFTQERGFSLFGN